MIIKYENNVMVVKHPSGHVDKYNRSDLERIKLMYIEEIENANNDLIEINTHIINLQLSEG